MSTNDKKESAKAKKRTASRLLAPAIELYREQVASGGVLIEGAGGLVADAMYAFPPTAAEKEQYYTYNSSWYSLILARAKYQDGTHMFPLGGIRDAAFEHLMGIDDEPFRVVYAQIKEAFGDEFKMLQAAIDAGEELSEGDQRAYDKAKEKAEAAGSAQHDGSPKHFMPDEAEALGNSADVQL